MKHIYYKNDFAVEITLLNASGEVVAPPEWEWHIEFTDGRRKYICSVDKGNANVVGNTIMCYLDNHKFCCGEIGYKFVQAIPDLNYLDGFQNLITPKALPIELWEQESDNDVNIQSSVVPAYVVYDAYMTAKANGYAGTAEEFYDALNHIVDIDKKEAERVEAEANRVTAEQQRADNFVAMESALTTATSKANTATTKAEEASKRADNSATETSQARVQATIAANGANAAAAQATQAMEKTNTATELANTATANANASAVNAGNAATEANEAAKNANDATEKAKTATTAAEQSAERANTAADNADVATSNATTATNQATTATKRANDISADLEAKREADYWRGAKGEKGDDGVSPTVSTSKIGKVTTIEITDAQGTHTATVNDGESVEVVQSTGNSTTSVMSQKAVSDALSNVYTKSESDAMFVRGEVLYEDYYYPNMGETTDKVNFTDSTEILQPTKFIGEYTDASGQKYNCVFECESFPDWFDFSERECYPYGNGMSTAKPFFKNYTIDNGELVYNFISMQNIDISKKLPYFTDNVGLKKIDDNHFNLYTAKNGVYEFTAFDKGNVDCSLFAFSPVTYNPIYDVDDCKLVRITLTGNIQSPSRYSSLLDASCDVGLIGYNKKQVLYGDEYVEIEIDKNNNRWRQVKSGYSMFYRSNKSQNWDTNRPESYESECRCLWKNIPNGTFQKICMINNKVCYSFTLWPNPATLLLMGCKIKIEKLA